jgi:hypothetical protein
MRCGREIPNDADFCPYCGSTVSQEVRQHAEEPYEQRQAAVNEYTEEESFSGRSDAGAGFLTKLRGGRVPTAALVILAIVVIAAVVAVIKVVRYFDRPILYVDHSANWEYIASGRREKNGKIKVSKDDFVYRISKKAREKMLGDEESTDDYVARSRKLDTIMSSLTFNPRKKKKIKAGEKISGTISSNKPESRLKSLANGAGIRIKGLDNACKVKIVKKTAGDVAEQKSSGTMSTTAERYVNAQDLANSIDPNFYYWLIQQGENAVTATSEFSVASAECVGTYLAKPNSADSQYLDQFVMVYLVTDSSGKRFYYGAQLNCINKDSSQNNVNYTTDYSNQTTGSLCYSYGSSSSYISTIVNSYYPARLSGSCTYTLSRIPLSTQQR